MASPSPGRERQQRVTPGTAGVTEPYLREKVLHGGIFFGAIAILGAAVAGSNLCRAVGIPVAVLCVVLAASALARPWPTRAQRVAGTAALAGALGVICWVVAG